MTELSGREFLLAKLNDEALWKIFDDLEPLGESELTRVLRPHDEVGLSSYRDGDAIGLRLRLDSALDSLTLVEIACEIGILRGDDLPLVKTTLSARTNFRKLVEGSGAFLRYASTYLYFGVCILAHRGFGPGWDTPQQEDDPERAINRRTFSLAVPPNPVVRGEANDELARVRRESLFDTFRHIQVDQRWTDALDFLDGFHLDKKLEEEVEDAGQSTSHETAQYELWLRAMLPEASSTQVERFQSISGGMVAWVRSRTDFYLTLQQPAAGSPKSETARQPQGDEIVTNPLAARFALADIYWIARLLRADVSAKASVHYARASWLNLLRFRATYDGNLALAQELRVAEEILRSVFDFVCDLVQNAVALSDQKEERHFNPDEYSRYAESENEDKHIREWRAVFDEELREIDRQRSQRTFRDPEFPADETLPTNASDAGSYWSERLITGRLPPNRIGVAFSGGGIRSATFNLGVLQGLQEFDLLRQVDYLSTVSGGGFIGSWLVGNVQRARQWLGKSTCWDESIAHLRAYSSYLAPLTGILSADTWTIAATWLRNTFLIQITGFAWLLALLLGGLTGRLIFLALACSYGSSDNIHLLVPLLALAMGILITASLAYNFTHNRVETGRASPGASQVRWLVVLPSWIGAFFLSIMLWAVALHWPGTVPAPGPPAAHSLWIEQEAGKALHAVMSSATSLCRLLNHACVPASSYASPSTTTHDYSFILKTAWQSTLYLTIAHWLSLLLIGWFALKPRHRIGSGGKDMAAPPRWRVATAWRSLWIGTLCEVVFYLAVCAILFLYLKWGDNNRYGSFAYVFGPALVLAAFTLSVVVFIGLTGRRSGEAQREWWTRFGAWLLIYAVAGLAISAIAVMGPWLVIQLLHLATGTKLSTKQWGAILGWLGTVLGGVFAGKSSKTAGDPAAGKNQALEILATVGGLTFVLGAALGTATVLYYLLLNIATNLPSTARYSDVLDQIDPLRFAIIFLVVILCGVLFSWFFEINIFGLSQFYRNRIVRCYLGATRWAPGARKPQHFTDFDFNDDMWLGNLKNDFRGPFPIFNCTLNLGGSSDLSVHTRHSASFSLTPLRCGADRPRVGYAPTGGGSLSERGASFAGGVRLGQAVAISGAAASPNMGYNTSPLAALLLTMFDVRLGWWFPNPGRRKWKASGLSFSLYYLSRELLGIADERRLFLNISDGGHFENLGIYELVRRRCKVIIASDAECDEVLQFGGLGNLVRICETDFGAVIDLDLKSIAQQKDGHSLAHCAIGKIKYSNGSIGYLIYLKASVTGDEEIGVTQYRSTHPSFPHETTANQFFSEDQFESYRKLGQHVVRQCLRSVQPGDDPVAVADKLADVMASARTSGEAFLKHTRTLDRMWDEFRRSPALHSFIDELMHITPPIAVVPPLPNNAHQASEELCMALQLMQLMEDVFMDLQLDDFWEHPDNRGWAILFMRWARSPRFRAVWNQTRRTFGIRFEYFCEARLGLKRDTPIVRV